MTEPDAMMKMNTIEEKALPLGRKAYVYKDRYQVNLGSGDPPDYIDLIDLRWGDTLLEGDYHYIAKILGKYGEGPFNVVMGLFLELTEGEE